MSRSQLQSKYLHALKSSLNINSLVSQLRQQHLTVWNEIFPIILHEKRISKLWWILVLNITLLKALIIFKRKQHKFHIPPGFNQSWSTIYVVWSLQSDLILPIETGTANMTKQGLSCSLSPLCHCQHRLNNTLIKYRWLTILSNWYSSCLWTVVAKGPVMSFMLTRKVISSGIIAFLFLNCKATSKI